MKLIIGLGNPGRDYAGNRHNIGFAVLDALADAMKIGFSSQSKFKGELAEARHDEQQRVFLLKPQTYMNLSGESALAVSQFYKIDVSDCLIVYDDLDLPPGKLRFAARGSAGGHNGVKSLISQLGTTEIPRLKIGIGRPLHPQHAVADFVLEDFSKSEQSVMREAIATAVTALQSYLNEDDLTKVMNQFNKNAT